MARERHDFDVQGISIILMAHIYNVMDAYP